MANFEIQSFMKIAVLLVTSGIIMAVLSSMLVVAEDVVSLPPLPQETHDFLEQCGAKLIPRCGEEMKASIYNNKRFVSEKCCGLLLDEGEACHNKFVEVTARFYPQLNQTEARTKALRIWDFCVELFGGYV